MDDDSRETSKTSDGALDKPVIYLTGFGPFGPHLENASEAAVSLISSSSLASDLGVRLVSEILDVDYAKTQSLVPQHWEHYKPQLVVHVGVSGLANRLTLEQCAYNTDYRTLDILQKCPPEHCCIPGGNKELKSGLPLESICDALNSRPHLRLKSCLSQDPGRYLCSYVYYTSLHRDRRRVVFVHVPPLDVCPAEDIAQSLSEAIVLLYRAIAEPTAALGSSTDSTADNSAESTAVCNAVGSAVKSSGEGCGCDTSLNGSGKRSNSGGGETELVPGITGKINEEKPKENEGESMTGLSCAMSRMSTTNGQALESFTGNNKQSKDDIRNAAEGSS